MSIKEVLLLYLNSTVLQLVYKFAIFRLLYCIRQPEIKTIEKCTLQWLLAFFLVLGLWWCIVFPDQYYSELNRLPGKRRTNNKTTMYLSEISHFLWSTSRLHQSPRTTTCNPKRFRLRFNLNYHTLEQRKKIQNCSKGQTEP